MNADEATPPFVKWLRVEFARLGVHGDTAIARQLGVTPSTVTRPSRWPRTDTMRAAAESLGVPIRRVLVAAGYLTAQEADVPVAHPPLSTVSSRELIDELDRRLDGAEERDLQGDPTADGEARSGGAHMKGADIAWLEDHRAPDVNDMIDRVTAEAELRGEEEGLAVRLQFAPDLAAARDVDGPTQGEFRRRPGKDAGEENQDPGEDWDGA